MKKTSCILLALCLCFALALPAVAAGTELNGESKDVTVTVLGIATGETVYKVDIDWVSLEFTYDYKETTSVWDPETHEYKITTSGDAGWVPNTAVGQQAITTNGVITGVSSGITIANHSNAAVKYTATMTDKIDVPGVNVELTGRLSETLESAEGKLPGVADYEALLVKVTGAPDTKTAATTAIKQLSITLTKAS